MRSIPFLALATAARAIVLPDVQAFEQLSIHEEDHEASWRDSLPSKESIATTFEETVDSVASSFSDALETISHRFHDEFSQLLDEADFDIEAVDRPHHPHHGHGNTNLTIYQLISESNHTTKFAELVNEYDDIVKLLNSTKANYTLFVPVDKAFEHLPHHDKKPSKEFIENVLRYHVGLGLYPAGRILATHTLPTALDEKFLGDKPQRLRTSVGIVSGVRVNFYSKVIVPNIGAKNGFIHAVNHILVPPPMVGRELTLFPSQFSTLLLAYEKTDFVSFIHGVKMTGSTVFAPTNRAFARLGPRANAFLFNTDKGKKYLTALLKYHIVANETLYSDAYYGSGDGESETVGAESERYHVDLPTLLDDKSVGVDVFRLGGFISMKVNRFAKVVVQDGIAKNGVIQVLNQLLIPGRPHRGEEAWAGGEIDVEDLMVRLSPYVKEDAEDEWMGDL